MTKRISAKEAARIADSIATECVGVRIRMLNRSTSRIYDEQLRAHGLKFSQMNILAAITLEAPVQPRRIAETLCIEKSTLSRNVRVMQSNGWIERIPGEAGNTQLLRTTQEGFRLLQKATPAWRTAQKRVESLLGVAAVTTIRNAADHVRTLEA